MKRVKNILIFLFLIYFSNNAFSINPESSGWKLGIQSYTFHHFSLKESITRASQLGIPVIEAFYNQPIEEGKNETLLTMTDSTRLNLLAFAKTKNVKIIATGVVSNKKREDWDFIFKRASEMGMEVITCEPKYEDLEYVDQLANKYQIDVAIHNHPKPSDYWTPELFLKNVEGLSDRIGACADVGHWKRMGIDPVEALREFGDRLKVIHLKDVEQKKEGKAYQDDVRLGEGICDIEAIFKELHQQNFRGFFSIEFEGDQNTLMDDMKQYVQFFNSHVSDLFEK
ncbi:MAG: sugar phosphate isomerase/epimerase [Bacteroidales bacterium]|nr:sugar phosphate isomerase/epimerase [Bacteroidales bacterium]